MEEKEIKRICSEALTKEGKEGLDITEVVSVDLKKGKDSDYEAEVEYVGEVNIEELRESYSGELIYARELGIKIESFSGDGRIHLSINKD